MFFRKKDTNQKVTEITNALDKAFKIFQKAYDEVETAQFKLQETIEESNKNAESLQAALELELLHQQKAKEAMEINEGLKQKLKEFTF